MPKIIPDSQNAGVFYIDGNPLSKLLYVIDLNDLNESMGIVNRCKNASSYRVNPLSYTEWKDEGDNPFSSYDDLKTYIADPSNNFFFSIIKDVEGLNTVETNPFLRLVPDGSGGVVWADNQNQVLYFGQNHNDPIVKFEFDDGVDQTVKVYKKSGDNFTEIFTFGSAKTTEYFIDAVGGGLFSDYNGTTISNIVRTLNSGDVLIGNVLEGIRMLIKDTLYFYTPILPMEVELPVNPITDTELTSISASEKTGYFYYEFEFDAPFDYIVDAVYVTTSSNSPSGRVMLSAYAPNNSLEDSVPLSSSADKDNYFNGDDGVMVLPNTTNQRIPLTKDFEVFKGDNMIVRFWSDTEMIWLGGDVNAPDTPAIFHPSYAFDLTFLQIQQDLAFVRYKHIESIDNYRYVDQSTNGLISNQSGLQDYQSYDFVAGKTGVYEFKMQLHYSLNSNNTDFLCDFELYESTDLVNPVERFLTQVQEVKDSGGQGEDLDEIENGTIIGTENSGTNQRYPVTSWGSYSLASGNSYTLKIRFGCSDNDDRATIYDSIMSYELKEETHTGFVPNV
jgi:hypothetical protein